MLKQLKLWWDKSATVLWLGELKYKILKVCKIVDVVRLSKI